jgi:hypothetical protein
MQNVAGTAVPVGIAKDLVVGLAIIAREDIERTITGDRLLTA